MTKKLLPFKVVRTPKIKDSRGEYVKRGETAMLTKEVAEHYHKLGYVQVSMDGVFDEATSDGPEPDSEAGGDDESAASEDASSDAGESAVEAGEGLTTNRRRRRTTG